MRWANAAVCAFLALAALACGGEETATQLLVTVRAGTALDRSLSTVTLRTTGRTTATFDLAEDPLPLSVGVLPKDGELSTVTITAEAFAAGDTQNAVFSDEAVATFVKNTRVDVELVLGPDVGADGGMYPPCDGEDCVPVPSYLASDHWGLLYAEGTKDLVVQFGETYTFDTDTGEVVVSDGAEVEVFRAEKVDGLDANSGIGFKKVAQGAGLPDLGVFYLKGLTLDEPSSTVKAVGDNALVILASGAVSILGMIDVGAQGSQAGPGGRDGLAVFAPAADRLDENGNSRGTPENTAQGQGFGGGGGGGNGGPGGRGGTGRWYDSEPPSENLGGTGGMARGSDDLVGGGGGGAGHGVLREGPALRETAPSVGGGGGGAVFVASAVGITVAESGVIRAPGDGASVAASPPVLRYAGGGGGAGGTVVLEAPAVTVDRLARIAANGGGGQGGSYANAHSPPGEGGGDGVESAAGGVGGYSTPISLPGMGGGGAAGDDMAGVDGQAEMCVEPKQGAGGGGGGGGPGRIVIRAMAGAIEIHKDAILSPSVETTLAITDGEMRRGKIP